MSQATQTLAASRSPHIRVVGAVSAAHFVSHYFIILLAPLMPFVRDEYGVSYTEIGFAFAAFNVVSAALQTPAGFLVDRLGARVPLIGALLIGAAAFTFVGLVDSFWFMVAMFALAGVGNAVYHPADYSLLSHSVPAERIGQAYSVHTFAGMLGSGVAPVSVLFMQSLWGWRGAFIGSALLGLVVAALLLGIRDPSGARQAAQRQDAGRAKDESGWRMLMAPAILLNLAFFVMLALMSGGVTNYSIVALGALHGTSVAVANAALTAFLLLSAIGVLTGGAMVGWTSRHGTVAALCLIGIAASTALVAEIDLGDVLLLGAMGFGGFLFGLMMPARDMLVREATPPGSFGKVFGFVTTGFNIGGIIAPLVFGAVMDHGAPRLVFLGVAACALAAIATVATLPRRAGAK